MNTATVRKHAIEPYKISPRLAVEVAREVSDRWCAIQGAEDMFMQMGQTRKAWRAAPAVQNAMAALIGDMTQDAQIYCGGFQGYGWMQASGHQQEHVHCNYLGKIRPSRVIEQDAGDIAPLMKKKNFPVVVALHIEDAEGWKAVRAISAAAVKAEASILMLISAAIPAPQGVALDTYDNLADAAPAIRSAMESVREQGAIRVLAVEDMSINALEAEMMNISGMDIASWQNKMQACNDIGQRAINAAYRAAVEI